MGLVLRTLPLLAGLLLLASCNGADAPDGRSSPPSGVWFAEEAALRGIDFVHRSGHLERHLMPEALGSGGALFDMDGDGDLDAYLVQSGSLTDPDARLPGNRLYENDGTGRFRDVSADSGAEDDGYGMGAACADYDNDGDVDLYITNYGADRLLRNDGAGRFTDVTEAAGLGHEGWGSSAGFFDYDRDGDLDLFVVNYINWSERSEIECYNQMGQPDYCSPNNYDAPAMDALYRNDGDGRFTDVTVPAGMNQGFGNGLGFVFGDFTGDGWLDVFVANDGLVDQLWVNRQDGTFVDNALLAGCAVDLEGGVPKAGMGVTAGDVDDDGDLDLMVCNLVDETDSVYRNEGQYFTDVTARSGLGTVSRWFTRFGMGWVEFDNDGNLDLYQANGRVRRASELFADDPFAEPNLLFRGIEGGTFDEVNPRGGTDPLLSATSRGALFGDVDNDGGIDVLVSNRDGPVHLLHNVVAGREHWVTFRVLEEHGRDAEGAALFVTAGGRRLRRDVRAGFSYLACNDPRVHVGLADAASVDSVEVHWVDGAVETFGPFEPDRIIELRRGNGR